MARFRSAVGRLACATAAAEGVGPSALASARRLNPPGRRPPPGPDRRRVIRHSRRALECDAPEPRTAGKTGQRHSPGVCGPIRAACTFEGRLVYSCDRKTPVDCWARCPIADSPASEVVMTVPPPSSPAPVAPVSYAKRLLGLQLEGGWTVVSRLPRSDDATGAHFSEGRRRRNARSKSRP